MKIREPNFEDLQEVDAIFDRNAEKYVRPTIEGSVGHVVAEEEGEILGYGIINVFLEASIILDKSRPPRARLRALDALVEKGVGVCRELGVKFLFIQVYDEKYGIILKKKYGFKSTPGTVLSLEV